MPVSVWISVLSLGFMMLVSLLFIALAALKSGSLPIGEILRLFVAFLVLLGLVRGHKLAWQWGRYLAFLSGAITLVLGVLDIMQGGANGLQGCLIILLLALPSLAIAASLGVNSAKIHFKLICPKCGNATSRAADFFFRKAKCGQCGNIW